MMDDVQDLVRRVASAAPAADVARGLGPPAEGEHGAGVLAVAPRAPSFSSALVIPGTLGGIDYVSVRVHLRPGDLTIGDLRRAFGEHGRLPSEPGSPRWYTFTADDPAQPFVCGLSAEAVHTVDRPTDADQVIGLVANRGSRGP